MEMSSHNGKVSRKTDSEVVKTIEVKEKNAPTDLILNENGKYQANYQIVSPTNK